MKIYARPILFSHNPDMKPLLNQYFLDGQEMALINGHDFCGQVIQPPDTFELCLNNEEDVSSQLAGLIISSTLNGNQTIASCHIQPLAECPGTYYICTIADPAFEHVQCITSISDGEGNSISCDSDTCTPDVG